MSLAELASQLGVSESTVTDWEEGERAPPSHVMRSLDFITGLGSAPPAARGGSGSGKDVTQHSFPWVEPSPSTSAKQARTGAFTDNMKLPIHRWFRYSAGFSAEWIAKILGDRRDGILFDPFAGSGTALVAARSLGVVSAGAERHPFVHRIARTKLAWNADIAGLSSQADHLLATAKRLEKPQVAEPELLVRCYSTEALARLAALRGAWSAGGFGASVDGELLWLAITSILRECSGVGTAQWQYVLPNKSKAKVVDPYVAFMRRIEMFCADLAGVRGESDRFPPARLERDDARTLESFQDLRGRVTCVITSPPYPNNYDYADATRLEMTFWGEIATWGDLHRVVRNQLVRSCSQHSAADGLRLPDLLADPLLEPILNELRNVTSQLEEIRETKGGKKTYHTMIAAYFADLARVWQALRPLCAGGADICFVVGDSAPYGVHVPVEKWLGELALAAGFHSARFDKIRDRNIKWRNRKHQVPLKEGNLWLKA